MRLWFRCLAVISLVFALAASGFSVAAPLRSASKTSAKKSGARVRLVNATVRRGILRSRQGGPRLPPSEIPTPTPRPTPTPLPTPTATPTPAPTPTPTALPLRMFPFALPPFDSSQTATNVSWMNVVPAGKNGFLRARGEQFVDGRGAPVRLWGVNFNFAGVFPPKDEAPKIAARLAKFGFNAARFHHYDGYAAPSGIWKAASVGSSRIATPRQFDEDQVDRFDFFVSELIKRGIYIDLNLHVGRKIADTEGIERAGALPEKDKGINYFDTRLRELQNDFSRAMLTHVNPYLGRALKDEPGLCAVEVANENSLLGLWLDGTLSKALPEHTQVLYNKWNLWLAHNYSETTLRAAWTEIDEPVQQINLLAGPLPFDIINPDAPDARIAIAAQTLQSGWQLSTVTGAQGTLLFDRISGPTIEGSVHPGLTANLTKPGTVSWAFQVNRDGIDVQEGHPYTLSFWARSDIARQISVNLWQDRPPHRFAGFTGFANLNSDWQQFSFVFRPSSPDPMHSRLTWNLGSAMGTIQIGEVSLREGGRIAAPVDWTLDRGVPLIDFKSTQVLVARRDFAEFLSSVEEEQVVAQRKFLLDLGVKVPVWHTQAQFGGWGGVWRELQSDAIDVHAYWKHPDFLGAGWSGSTWKIDNQSMTGAAGVDPLSGFALFRVPGKPFVMTEWNSGQPNDFSGESLLMPAAYAAWQDWASVYLFDYHSAGPYDRNKFEGFFSIDSHPVKMATAPAAALLYRRPDGSTLPASLLGDVSPSETSTTLTLPRNAIWLEVASAPGGPTAAPIVKTWKDAGAARGASLIGRTYAQFGDGIFPVASTSTFDDGSDYVSDTRQMSWDRRQSTWTLNAPKSKAAIGILGGSQVLLDEWRLSVPRTQNNFGAYALSSLDGRDISASKRLLLTAVGRAENVGMGWNAEHNSVGTQWGDGPTQVEGLTSQMEVLTDAPQLSVWALDTTGMRRATVPSRLENGVLRFAISPDYQTLWYEIAAL